MDDDGEDIYNEPIDDDVIDDFDGEADENTFQVIDNIAVFCSSCTYLIDLGTGENRYH